jgi:hypothetical protein
MGLLNEFHESISFNIFGCLRSYVVDIIRVSMANVIIQ